MKRIILGLSVFLLLVQNSFAKTDAEWDELIASASLEVNKQINRCNKEANNKSGNPVICEKALSILHNEYPDEKSYIAGVYLNAGLLYDRKGNKLKAYEYYMKSAKLGNLSAQKNLNIMCKETPWACK